jgi:signal recognition particle subunit SRP54
MSSFTLDDFRNQLNTAVEPGLLLKMTRMLPANSPLHQMLIDGKGIKQLRRQIGIVDSMTVQERKGPELINEARIRRISEGSGVGDQEVVQMLRTFQTMRHVIDNLGEGPPPRYDGRPL